MMVRLPLQRYELLHCQDLDTAREAAGWVFAPYRIDVTGGQPNVRLHSHRLRDVALSYVTFGADVTIGPACLETFYLVQAPLSGRADIRCGSDRIQATRRVASVVSPNDPLTMRWSADCATVVIRIERAALEARLSDLLDASLRRPLRFESAMDLSRIRYRTLHRGMRFLLAELDHPESLSKHPVVAHEIERTLMTAFLLTQPSNYTSLLDGDGTAAPSRAVSLALEWVESRPQATHSSASLARVAGVSERALQLAFRKHLRMRPMEYVREVRLRRVRDELRVAQPDTTTVAKIAADWGFLHTGHFAAKYRATFGEKPSETLRR